MRILFAGLLLVASSSAMAFDLFGENLDIWASADRDIEASQNNAHLGASVLVPFLDVKLSSEFDFKGSGNTIDFEPSNVDLDVSKTWGSLSLFAKTDLNGQTWDHKETNVGIKIKF